MQAERTPASLQFTGTIDIAINMQNPAHIRHFCHQRTKVAVLTLGRTGRMSIDQQHLGTWYGILFLPAQGDVFAEQTKGAFDASHNPAQE